MRDDEEKAIDTDKLIPEWSVDADDQIKLAGLLVAAIFVGLFLWNSMFGGNDELATDLIPSTADVAVESAGDDDAGVAAPVVTTPTQDAAPEPAPEPEAEPVDLQSVVNTLDGDVNGELNGTTAVLTGFVANQTEKDTAETLALQQDGVDAVDNQLQLLEPAARAELEELGVVNAEVNGDGTVLTVSGTIADEAERQPALDAVADVDGVSEVIDDRLEVSVAADLNELPQVQFAYASADILPGSFADLDQAAELLTNVDNGTRIEIQGYTDITGSDEDNKVLSQERTESVRQYLIDAGVSPDVLTAVGYGETEQFGEGTSPEALAANRLVRFEQV